MLKKTKLFEIISSIWKHGLRSPYIKSITESEPVSNLLKGATGSGLTNAQVLQNDWNADQAQEQRDWEERMDNTKYQRQVNDMQSAGLNPAMMYGQGYTASTPSGSAASGSSVASPSGGVLDSILNVVFAKQRLSNLRAEEENTRKDTELKGSQIEVNTKTLDEIDAKIKNFISSADLNESQKDQVDKVTSWIDRERESLIDLQGSEKSFYEKETKLIDHKIKNLDADTAKKWQEILNLRQDICESLQRVENLKQEAIESGTRASLNVDLLDEIAGRVKVYDEQVKLFQSESGLTEKQLKWYWVDHGLMPGLKLGVTSVAGAAAGGVFGPARTIISGFR